MPKEIRFAVGIKTDLRSSVWMLWGNKDDLYLASRTTAGLTKFSFHKSGICRYAVVSTTPRPARDTWKRPKESDPGITPVMTIVVPAIDPKDRLVDHLPPANKKIVFLPAPEINMQVVIRILLTKPTFTEAELRKLPSNKPLFFHGNISLLNETAWLMSYYDQFSISDQSMVLNLLRETRVNFTGSVPTKDEMTFASLHVLTLSDPPYIFDLPLSLANLHLDPGGSSHDGV